MKISSTQKNQTGNQRQQSNIPYNQNNSINKKQNIVSYNKNMSSKMDSVNNPNRNSNNLVRSTESYSRVNNITLKKNDQEKDNNLRYNHQDRANIYDKHNEYNNKEVNQNETDNNKNIQNFFNNTSNSNVYHKKKLNNNNNIGNINKLKINTQHMNDSSNLSKNNNIINGKSNYNNNNNNSNSKNIIQKKGNMSIDKRKEFNKLNIKKINENLMNKELEKIKEKERSEESDIITENYLCYKCNGNIFIKLNLDKLLVITTCKNCKEEKVFPIKVFNMRNPLKKDIVCDACRNTFLPKHLYYCSCSKNICGQCKKKHKTHFQVLLSEKCYYCTKHGKKYTSYCTNCNKDICHECLHEHNKHYSNIEDFESILPQEKDIKMCKYNMEKMRQNKINFDKKNDIFFEAFKNKRNNFDQNFEDLMKLQNYLINKMNNKEIINYEDIKNFKELNKLYIQLKKSVIQNYLDIYNNFVSEGKFLINLFAGNDIEKDEKKENIIIKSNNLKILSNKKKLENTISKSENFTILKNNKNMNNNKNLVYKNKNNANINDNNKNIQSKFNEVQKKKYLVKTESNNDNNNINIKSKDSSKESNLRPYVEEKITVLDKIENCKSKHDSRDERCITSFAILRNNRILITFKGGIIKIYEFERNYKSPSDINNPNEIQLKEILRLEEDEYCFNYGIEFKDGNLGVCSEDGTVKIIKLFFDEKPNSKEKYKIIQRIEEKNQDPIYIIKELTNENFVLGCWRNILVYQKANEYELINKIFIGDYTFSILELSPNEIISNHTEIKALTVHNLNNYDTYTINNIESNENNNIICKYDNKNDIVFVAYNKGINIVSIINKCLIKKIDIKEEITGLCPMEMTLYIGDDKTKNIFGLLCGAKRKIYGENVNFAFSLLQIGFNINNKDKGEINVKDNKDIKIEIISRKDRIHYYDIVDIQNSIFSKNNNTLKINENKNEQWIFSTGKEDKKLRIWKI